MRRNGNIFHASKRHSTIINNHTIVNTKIPSDFRYLQENEKKNLTLSGRTAGQVSI